jgi:nucleoside-diphosphate-sugar epimerase
MGAELENRRIPFTPIAARLEDTGALTAELDRLPNTATLILVQLAAKVSVAECEADPEAARHVNVDATVATFEAFADWCHAAGVSPRLVYVSTGHVYAPPPPGRRVSEGDGVAPRSVYAATKLEAEKALSAVGRRIGVDVLVARVFGLLAPGQPSGYLLPSLIRRVRDGDVEAIPGLSFGRDYLDARDVCRHLTDLAQLPITDIVNVCSGEVTTVRDVLDAVIDRVVEDDDRRHKLRGRASEAEGRPTDIPWLVGDPTRLSVTTGSPLRTIELSETVGDAVVA